MTETGTQLEGPARFDAEAATTLLHTIADKVESMLPASDLSDERNDAMTEPLITTDEVCTIIAVLGLRVDELRALLGQTALSFTAEETTMIAERLTRYERIVAKLTTPKPVYGLAAIPF